MVTEGSMESPSDSGHQTIEGERPDIGTDVESFFSPRFKSAAAMAGWDEEALLIASLVVDDTPEREFRSKKRSDLQSKSPPTNSRRKRRTCPSNTVVPVPVLVLDEEETTVEGDTKKDTEIEEVNKKKNENSVEQNSGSSSSSSSALPCLDKLREELSCAICLEICFEPSTTPCGHSFCKKCLRSAADKCGRKCPKCREIISNGRRSCTINTVLWNTIQLLFPQEVEARKETKGGGSSSQEKVRISERALNNNLPNRNSAAFSRNGRERRLRFLSNDNDDDDEEEEIIHGRLSDRFERRRRQLTVIGSDNDDGDVRFENRHQSRMSNRSIRPMRVIRNGDMNVRSRGITSQDEDAALALRLQREEFMEAFTDNQVQTRSSVSFARANLRAMASRASNFRLSGGRHL